MSERARAEYGVAAPGSASRPDKVAFVHRRPAHHVRASSTRRSPAPRGVLHARGVGPDARLGHRAAQPAGVDRRRAAARRASAPRCVPIPQRRDRRRAGRTSAPTARSRSCSTKTGLAEFLADARRRRRPSRRPTPRPTTSRCGRTRRARPGGPKAVLRPVRRRRERRSTGWCATTTSYGIGAPDEVNLTASPLHHLAGFSGPHSALLLGHTCVLLDHFDAAEAIAVMERERVTYCVVRARAPLPADPAARRREGSGRRVERSSACCTARRRARRA